MKTHTTVCNIANNDDCLHVRVKEKEEIIVRRRRRKKAILTVLEYNIEVTQIIRNEREIVLEKAKKVYLTFNSYYNV